MNIAKFCIRHKVTTLLAVIMIAVFGVVYTTQTQPICATQWYAFSSDVSSPKFCVY